MLPPSCLRPNTADTTLAVQKLRCILRKWHLGRYESPPGDFLAYVLDYDYWNRVLKEGGRCLKSADRQRVGVLQDAAAHEGFTVALAAVDADEIGAAKHEYRWSNPSIPQMEEVVVTKFSMSRLGYLDGKVMAYFNRVEINEKPLIQEDFFRHMEPTSEEYERMDQDPDTVCNKLTYSFKRLIFSCSEATYIAVSLKLT